MSEDNVVNELTRIKGLNRKSALKLFRAGIKSTKKLGSSNPDELSKITGMAKKQLTTWVILARAQERKKFIEVDTAAAELSQLIEIKQEDAKRLVSSGVMSVEDLADESADLLSEDTGLAAETIQRWIKKAKEVKRMPVEKRKVVIVPSAEATFGSKLPGAFFGKSEGFTNIYNDSSSFGQSLIFVILTSLLLWLYLSMSQATFDIGGSVFSLTSLWEMTQISMVLEIGTMQITFYPLVFIGGMVLVIVIWLLLGKIVSSARNLEFKGTTAVLGFALAPGILLSVVIVGKFVPIIGADMRTWLLPGLLVFFGGWAVITFLRGLAFSPRDKGSPSVTSPLPTTFGAPKPTATQTPFQVVEERPVATAQPIQSTPTTLAAPTAPARRAGPVPLSNFGIIPQNEVATLQQAGYSSSIDLLRANSKTIAENSGIPQSKIIIWRIISDLLRVSGLTLEFAMILAKSGVRSVKHLAKINENALKVQVLDTISKENIPTSITATMLSDWIQEAQSL